MTVRSLLVAAPRWLILSCAVFALTLGVAACDSGGGDGTDLSADDGLASGDGASGDGALDEAGAPTDDELDDPVDEPELDPWSPGPDCLFDEAMVGKDIGDHLQNISVLTYTGDRYDLHQSCG